MRRLVLLALSLSLLACAPTQQKPETPELTTYTEEQIHSETDALMQAFAIPDEMASHLRQRLAELLADDLTQKRLETIGCNAVGVFEFGQGGFIIAGGSGGGLVSFSGGAQAAKFTASEVSIGATVGGENTHGLLLVFGLAHQERFTDGYTFQGTGGTIATTSFEVGQAVSDRGTHIVQYVGTGTGAMGDASFGTGQLVLTPPGE